MYSIVMRLILRRTYIIRRMKASGYAKSLNRKASRRNQKIKLKDHKAKVIVSEKQNKEAIEEQKSRAAVTLSLQTLL